MNKHFFLFFIISLIIALISYLAMENIFISIGILAIYLLTSVLVLIPLIKNYQIKIKKFHECYHFINNFIISLSIKKSIPGALETTVASMPGEFTDFFSGIPDGSDNEKLKYLTTYFEYYDYQLFLQILELWQEEGGEIIEMSKYLISDVRSGEEYLSKTENIVSSKYVEIGILWTITMAIIVLLKYSLGEFYKKVQTQLIFIIPITIIFIFLLFNIYLLVKRGTRLDLKGCNQDEKNA